MATLTVHLTEKTLPHDVEFEILDVGDQDVDLEKDFAVLWLAIARRIYEAHGIKNAFTELPEAQE